MSKYDKYISGIYCVITGTIFLFKKDFFTNNTNIVFGQLFIFVGSLFFHRKDEDE